MKEMIRILFCMGLIWQLAGNAALILSDDFGNGNLATGGVNGGFNTATNTAGGSGAFSEAGGNAVITASGRFDNSGITSITSFDSGGIEGFRVRWDIDSAQNPSSNGINLTIQQGGGFYGSATPHIRLRFGAGDTFSFSGQNGNGGNSFHSEPIDLAQALDGFSLEATFTPAGWSYTTTGIVSLPGNAGIWVGTHDYDSLFGVNSVVGAFIQRGRNTGNRTLRVNDISVVSVPEPSTICAFATLLLVGWFGFRRHSELAG